MEGLWRSGSGEMMTVVVVLTVFSLYRGDGTAGVAITAVFTAAVAGL